VEFVAEIGSNFAADLDEARDYVRKSAAAGATSVKFQTLEREKLVAPYVLSDGAWVDNPVYQGFKNVGLPDEWHEILLREAAEVGVEFFSTPFYLEAVDVMERAGVNTYKIASGDISFVPLLQRVGATGKRVILSTGGSTLGDVAGALRVLRSAGASDIILLHCVVSYPPLWGEVNLRAMCTLQSEFGLPVGLSDHTPGSLLAIAARALGASVIEKHVTKDRSLPGPDHPFAMTFGEFEEMVSQVRTLETALGTGEKTPTSSEMKRQDRFRRGIYDPVTLRPALEGIWLRPRYDLGELGK
jgi:N,N'-diacetyllegionaminate synthase